jgi:peptidoglycan/LPS O-acetylase OafA/YrhL
MSARGSDRLAALDGLRGLAALTVVFSHYLEAFFPLAWSILFLLPLRPLYDGDLAVSIFFVLSGFVIARSVRGHARPLPTLLLRRVLRLSLPMAASLLFAALLLLSFPDVPAQLRLHVPSDWIRDVYNPPDTGMSAIARQMLGSAYLGERTELNPPLWTMRTELIGSLALYAFYKLAPAVRRRGLLLVALVVLLAANLPGYVCFCLGALFCETGRTAGTVKAGFQLALGLLLVPAALVMGGIPGAWLGEIYAASAAFIVLAVLSSPLLQKALSLPPLRYAGRISFALYLSHFPLLLTVGAFVYLKMGGTGWAAVQTAPLFLALAMAIAYLGARFVDEPVLRLLRRADDAPPLASNNAAVAAACETLPSAG